MTQKKSNLIKILSAAIVAAMLLCLIGCADARTGTEEKEGSAQAHSPNFISAASTQNIGVSAHSAILLEMQSGTAVFQKNADERMPMASTTKIMTALVALERCDVSRMVTISPDAVGVEGSSIYLFADERITMEDLLYGLLLSSANDAAAAIAIEIGGSIEGFADMMNARAQ